MKVKFRTYCGLAGDLEELLIARSDTGIEESQFINRFGFFRHYRLERAKNKLVKKIESKTGIKQKERRKKLKKIKKKKEYFINIKGIRYM